MSIDPLLALSTPRQIGGALRGVALAGLLIFLVVEWWRRRRVKRRTQEALARVLERRRKRPETTGARHRPPEP